MLGIAGNKDGPVYFLFPLLIQKSQPLLWLGFLIEISVLTWFLGMVGAVLVVTAFSGTSLEMIGYDWHFCSNGNHDSKQATCYNLPVIGE